MKKKQSNDIDIDVPNLWQHFKDGISKTFDEVCGKKRGRTSKADARWWNKEKEAVSRKKDSQKVMCQNSTVEKKRRHKIMKNKAKKAVSKAMGEKAEEALTE